MSKLLVISSAPATYHNGSPYLDPKFIAGMHFYNEAFDGQVSGVLKLREGIFPFGKSYDLQELPFDVALVSDVSNIDDDFIRNFDVILCSGDNHEFLFLGEMCKRLKKKIFFIIEYIPETRRQIILLDTSRSFLRKSYSIAWMMNKEYLRQKAFRSAHGIQANGYPAFERYRKSNPNVMMYLDNRVGTHLLVPDEHMKARQERLLGGEPVRLLHSGRLEPLKGSHDLIPIARQLVENGVDFTLDIFGTGSLEESIRAEIVEFDLQDKVRLHGAVDFERDLVPFAQQNADIYLSCHRQSDPSCTYIESMGCGLAVVGYRNRMWSTLCAESQAGWIAPLGKIAAIAQQIERASDNRSELVAACLAARDFASKRTFEIEFNKRIDHIVKQL